MSGNKVLRAVAVTFVVNSSSNGGRASSKAGNSTGSKSRT